jgi:3-isopropylmalate dehydrogenase
VGLMLRHSFAMTEAADALSAAVARTLDDGYRTRDIADEGTDPAKLVGTAEMGDQVVARL